MTCTCTVFPGGFQIGLAPSPAPAPLVVTSSTVPKTKSESTMTELRVIQVADTRVLPWIGGPSSSSPSRWRQTISAYAKYTSTNSITGAAITAITLMSNCWLEADDDMSPGGRCGPQTTQISTSATTDRISHGMKIRMPWFGPLDGPACCAGAGDSAAIRTPPPCCRS